MSSRAQRLGKNLNGYVGETIDLESVLADCLTAAQGRGWAVEEIQAAPGIDLLALTRVGSTGRETADASTGRTGAGAEQTWRVYLSAGIHGDEPAGPLAVRQLLQEDDFPKDVNFWLLPCLNPRGFGLNRRENGEGLDLNRQYLNPVAAETLAHMAWLKGQPGFDVCLCLHEDWESHGFYVYELNPDNRPSLAEPIVQQVAEVCPIDLSDLIEGRPAHNGIIRPSSDPRSRPQWPEAFYLLTHKTRLSYTLEAPSDFPLTVRVAALTAGVRAALEAMRRTPTPRSPAAGSV